MCYESGSCGTKKADGLLQQATGRFPPDIAVQQKGTFKIAIFGAMYNSARLRRCAERRNIMADSL